MNLNNVSYVGIFVDHIDGELYTDIPNQHITLSYRPDSEKFSKLLNYLDTQCEVVVMGYGNDGKNEGLLVDIPSNIPYYGAEQKHITLSVGQDSSPVKTGFLKFENYIPENITSQLPEALYGKIAVFTKDKQVIYDANQFEDYNVMKMGNQVLDENDFSNEPKPDDNNSILVEKDETNIGY